MGDDDLSRSLRPRSSVRPDEQRMGAAGHGSAAIHRGLTVHLAAAVERHGRRQRALPGRLRSGSHGWADAAPSRGESAGTARSSRDRTAVRGDGRDIFESPSASGEWSAGAGRADRDAVAALLTGVGLDAALADALEDPTLDAELRAETDEALALTGEDIGRPIIHMRPPDGVASFGPVISRLPEPDDGVRMWDHVVGLVVLPGLAELNHGRREQHQLAAFGVAADQVRVQEDWHGGSRGLKK